MTLDLNSRASQLLAVQLMQECYLLQCESHISSLQQETENDKPQPKHCRKEKTSSALWSLFDELIKHVLLLLRAAIINVTK